MKRLIFKDRSFDIPDIVSGDPDLEGFPEFEASVIGFIREWYAETEFRVTTSGSTGPPKTIVLEKRAMQQSAGLTAQALGLEPGMTLLLAMNPNFIAGKMMIVRGLELDMDIVAVRPVANPIHELDLNQMIDFTALVPYQLQSILDEDQGDLLSSMKSIIIGGGAISPSLKQQIEKLEVPVYHTFSMTETITHIALQRLNGPDKTDHFKLLPGFRIEQDQRGCLAISGGFLKDKIVTNDLVEIIRPDAFRWIGRYDNMVNSGGIKLYPESLEPQVTEVLEGVGWSNISFFLAGIPDEKLGEKLVMFVEGMLNFPSEELIEKLKKKLGSYEAPKAVISIQKFEYTDTGKPRRKQILLNYLESK